MKSIITQLPNERWKRNTGKKTMEIGCPWLTYGAIIALETIIKPDFKVMEFGSGGSTKFFAARCSYVRSFETLPVWYNVVKEQCPSVNLSCMNEAGIIEALKQEQDKFYDIILVDSGGDDINRRRTRRLHLALAAIPKLKDDGWLVVDNYDQYMRDFDLNGWWYYTFDDLPVKTSSHNYGGKGTRFYQRKIV
jgi:hypothetical protein